jgi:hypothetical protein
MHLDALALLPQEYFIYFSNYCDITKSGKIVKMFQETIKQCNINVGNQFLLRTGKISVSAEPAGKSRMFAIANSWIQSVLKPFHDQLMLTLKLFKTDGTYDQIGQFNRLLKLSKGRMTYCFDLSKATDRYPIVLQQVVLEVIVNETFARAWVDLMTGLPFYNKGKPY